MTDLLYALAVVLTLLALRYLALPCALGACIVAAALWDTIQAHRNKPGSGFRW